MVKLNNKKVLTLKNPLFLKYRRSVMRLLVHFMLLAGVVIWLYPFIWMISASLKTNAEYFVSTTKLIPAIPQWQNYIRAWETGHFSQYFFNSLVIGAGTTLIVLTISCLTGYVLGRYEFPGRRILLFIVAAAVFFPVGYTVIPVYQLIRALGLTDTLAGVILAQAGGTPTLFILLFAVHFSSIPRDLEDAAVIDGAGFFRTFKDVFLPLSKPIIASGAILRFMWSWNDFLIPLIYTLRKPELRTVSVGVFAFVGEHTTDNTGMVAGAVIALLPLLILFIFFQRYFIEATAGSVKM
jgi:multiple sugar transport system permease protein